MKKLIVFSFVVLVAGCAAPQHISGVVEQSYRDCLLFGGTPKYAVSGNSATVQCVRPGASKV